MLITNKHISGVKENKSGTKCSARILASKSPDAGAKSLTVFFGLSAGISLPFRRSGNWAIFDI